MRIFIAGIDGYLGWSLAKYLSLRGHTVSGCDVFYRRKWVKEVGSQSALPIELMPERQYAFLENTGYEIGFKYGNLKEYKFVESTLMEFKPDCIIHFAEMPSAPYSMIDHQHAVWTQVNNISGTLNLLWAMKAVCPDAHLLKLGSMGEWGTPNIDIPEGFFTIEYRGRYDTLPFPRQAGSFYHQSKVHDSHNVMFACKIWGLKSTDIMQGVVFGTRINDDEKDDRLFTRFDTCSHFGTAVNRFCAQAVIGHYLTPYGIGKQTRGYLPLRDSMQCLTLAIENPPNKGEYRVFNQFEEIYSVMELAEKVQKVGNKLGLNVQIKNIENPRIELEEHYYNPDHQKLLDLGYKPTHDMEKEIDNTLRDLIPFRERIEERKEVIIPDTRWDGTKRKSKIL